MNNDQQPAVTTPQAPVLAPENPVTPAPPKKRPPVLVFIAIFLGVVVLSVIITVVQNQSRSPETNPTITPTVRVTPTPVFAVSKIATDSAFIVFHNAVASLSATLSQFSILDPSLTPPVLNTDLGLTQ